jgi:heme O synthase-like polyprenyltransferase
MGQKEVKGFIPQTSRILWSAYVVYLILFFTSLGLFSAGAMGVALVIFVFAIYDTKKIGEFCRDNKVEFPRKLWVFAVLTLFFTIITLPIYMYVRKNAIKQIFSNLQNKAKEGEKK